MRERENNGNLIRRMMRELDAHRTDGGFRTLEHLQGINLCSNDYLGLATDPRLKKAALDAVACVGAVGSTGSRLLSGNACEWEQLESEFAAFAGTESALYFSSGYLANVGLLSAIASSDDIAFSDALNHASLIDGIRLSRAKKIIYPHGDMQFLENALRGNAQHSGAKLIVTETVFSMEGDTAPIDSLLRLARQYRAELVVDEAHATGVLGPQGRGLAAQHDASREILAIVHTCGKALASAGAFVCCTETTKQYLVNRARTFIFSTAMPPYLAGQIHAALALVRGADGERAHLQAMGNLLREGLAVSGIKCGVSSTQIVPIMCGTNEAALHVAARLQAAGFAARAIRPPTVPAGTARVRLSLTAKITRDEIEQLAVTVGTALESSPAPQGAAVHG